MTSGRGRNLLGASVVALLCGATACSAEPPTIAPSQALSPLALERLIPLGAVKGRIDHLAVDLTGKRLFVAELANGSVSVIDLDSNKVDKRIEGVKEPQGLAWLPDRSELIVAGSDGLVRFFSAKNWQEVARIDLGADADNVRVDERNSRVWVGYGAGGLAAIDPVSHRLLGQITFKGHPESFRLAGSRAFVNVPDDGAVLAIDIDAQRVLARWPTGAHRLNFPLAIADGGKQTVIAYRLPAAVEHRDSATGKSLALQPSCGDADDLFLAGDRTMVICGAGSVDVLLDGKTEARVLTSPGARTGLFVPQLGILFVAAPARDKPAAIWALRFAWPVCDSASAAESKRMPGGIRRPPSNAVPATTPKSQPLQRSESWPRSGALASKC